MSPRTKQEFIRHRDADSVSCADKIRQIEADALAHQVGIGQQLAANMHQSLDGKKSFSAYFVLGDSTHDTVHGAFLESTSLPPLNLSDQTVVQPPYVFEFEGLSSVVRRDIVSDETGPHGVWYSVVSASELAAIAAN